MAVEKVREYLRTYHMEKRILEFDVSSATVELAAQAVGCEPERIAKTMSFLVNEEVILIVTAGDVKIDNKKYKQYFHAKAKMIPFEEVEEYIGHAPGGVCPFAVKEGVRTYLDESLKRFETVYPAAGSANSAVRLTPQELEQCIENVTWIDVCK